MYGLRTKSYRPCITSIGPISRGTMIGFNHALHIKKYTI